jgi:hypothetical protein
MKTKKILKITVISLSVAVVLFVALIVHLAMVINDKPVEPDDRQLSRIDFMQKVDSAEAGKIRSFVAHLDGVESTFFNVKDGILVYTYSLQKQSSQGVYDQLMQSGNYKAKRFVVSEDQAATGCPAMGGNKSFIYNMAYAVKKLIN